MPEPTPYPSSSANSAVKSATRLMAVLDAVAEQGAMSFAEIVEALALPKSSAHALLRTIEGHGYLALDEQRRYRLGSRIWELAQTFRANDDLRGILKPLMDEIVERTGETVQLARLDGVEAVYLGLSESPHPMKLTSRPGARLPAHASAIGKALLAELDESEAKRRLKSLKLAGLTDQTIVSVPVLLSELDEVRKRGYAVDNQEFAIGLRCVAVPIRDIDNQPVAALSVSMPTPRYNKASADAARAALIEAAERAPERLGHWRD